MRANTSYRTVLERLQKRFPTTLVGRAAVSLRQASEARDAHGADIHLDVAKYFIGEAEKAAKRTRPGGRVAGEAMENIRLLRNAAKLIGAARQKAPGPQR